LLSPTGILESEIGTGISSGKILEGQCKTWGHVGKESIHAKSESPKEAPGAQKHSLSREDARYLRVERDSFKNVSWSFAELQVRLLKTIREDIQRQQKLRRKEKGVTQRVLKVSQGICPHPNA